MVTLETILKKHFSCSVPFRKNGELTTSGVKAVANLLSLLNDLDYAGILDSEEPIEEIKRIIDPELNEE